MSDVLTKEQVLVQTKRVAYSKPGGRDRAWEILEHHDAALRAEVARLTRDTAALRTQLATAAQENARLARDNSEANAIRIHERDMREAAERERTDLASQLTAAREALV